MAIFSDRPGAWPAAFVLAAERRHVRDAGLPHRFSDDVVKLGVTNDQASIYSAATGIGVAIAAQMAAEDFGGTVLGKKIEIVSADNRNKPDVGVGIVNRWLDTGPCGRDRRWRQLSGRHGRAGRDAREEQAVPDHRLRHHRAH